MKNIESLILTGLENGWITGEEAEEKLKIWFEGREEKRRLFC